MLHPGRWLAIVCACACACAVAACEGCVAPATDDDAGAIDDAGAARDAGAPGDGGPTIDGGAADGGAATDAACPTCVIEVLRPDDGGALADGGTVAVGEDVVLSGRGASFCGPSGGTFAWELIQRPLGSVATLPTPDAPSTGFAGPDGGGADLAGSYRVRLTVQDDPGGASASCFVDLAVAE